jgi:hypothetical protein
MTQFPQPCPDEEVRDQWPEVYLLPGDPFEAIRAERGIEHRGLLDGYSASTVPSRKGQLPIIDPKIQTTG